MEISSSMIGAASTPRGGADMVGISVLKKAMDMKEGQNAQLLNSIPQAPRPGGQFVDLFA